MNIEFDGDCLDYHIKKLLPNEIKETPEFKEEVFAAIDAGDVESLAELLELVRKNHGEGSC